MGSCLSSIKKGVAKISQPRGREPHCNPRITNLLFSALIEADGRFSQEDSSADSSPVVVFPAAVFAEVAAALVHAFAGAAASVADAAVRSAASWPHPLAVAPVSDVPVPVAVEF